MMTDRKPKGSTPVAAQRPKSSQSNAAKGAGPEKSAESAPAQSAPVNDKGPGPQGQQAQQGASPQGSPQQKQPAQAPPSAKQPSAPPKTAGEIAAESGASPGAPAPKPAQQPSAPQSTPATPAPEAAAARTARLRLARVDPWSVMKISFALSIALAIVTVIAISIVWFVLGAAGVWDAVNSSVASLLSDDAGAFDVTEYVGYGRVIGFALLVSAVDVVLITAIATLGAFLYNLAAGLLGGFEVTLAEDT